MQLITDVGLAEWAQQPANRLSGGQQQRVAVARALVQEPRAVLADEPTGNLDPLTGEGVQNLLLALNREHDITLVVVTHSAATGIPYVRSLAPRRHIST